MTVPLAPQGEISHLSEQAARFCQTQLNYPTLCMKTAFGCTPCIYPASGILWGLQPDPKHTAAPFRPEGFKLNQENDTQ